MVILRVESSLATFSHSIFHKPQKSRSFNKPNKIREKKHISAIYLFIHIPSAPCDGEFQMLHLHHSLSIPTNNLQNPSIFFLSHSITSVSCSGLKRWGIIKNSRKRRKKFPLVEAVEKDSEFEVDQDKAREALRKLDEKLQSISQKQIDPPKIRGNISLNSPSVICVCSHRCMDMNMCLRLCFKCMVF